MSFILLFIASFTTKVMFRSLNLPKHYMTSSFNTHIKTTYIHPHKYSEKAFRIQAKIWLFHLKTICRFEN